MNNYNCYFAYSRTAFKFGISLLKLSEGEEILFPNYLCEEILHPIKNFNITPVFYKIFDDFTPDWDDINKNISSKTRAIVAIHYFGKPQNLKKFKELCKIKNIFLIEDNAHGWGSKYQNQYLGTIGDIGFSSPRKTLETKTGGVLHLKNKKLKNPLTIPTTNNFFNLWSYIHYIKENLKQKKFFLHLLKNQPKYWDINGFNENELDDKFIDKYSLRYINNCDLREIVEKRRKLYFIWEKFIITKTNLTPVFKKINNNVSPLVFPAYTKSFEQSKTLYNWGWNNAIDVRSWPSLPEKFKENRKIVDRWQKLVCFPIQNHFNPLTLKNKLEKITINTL